MLLLLIKFLDGLMVAKKPYLMQTGEVSTQTRAAYLYKNANLYL